VAGKGSSSPGQHRRPKRQLRVVMVTPRYLPHIGGVERYVHEISTRLVRDGLDVTVLTTDPTGELPASEDKDGVRIVRVRAWPRNRDYYFAPDIYRMVSTGAWDLMHVQSYHTFVAPLAMLAARRRGLPYVVTFHAGGHSSWVRRAIRRPQWALLRPLLANADRLVAIAPFEIDVYSKRLNVPWSRFVLIPLGTDLGRLEQVKADDAAGGPIIASIGRLERYKGHHRLIEALPYILEREPGINLWIGGSGPYEKKLSRIARKLRVSDRVEIRAIPATDRAAMARALGKVSLVVLLSEYETQPAVALEAIALGRPVLVLDTTGLSELAKQGLARAIPPDSTAEAIADAVLDQLRNPFLPTRIDLPSWDDCVDEHLDLYGSVAADLS
jgi:glycosyltransferase involved in cell wall biosynthesis